MNECPHVDVRRSRVVVDGVMFVLCPTCAATWEGPKVGPPPDRFDPPEVDDASLGEEYHELRMAKLLVEHTAAELDAARMNLKREILRIRRYYGVTFKDIGAQMGMNKSAPELYVHYQAGEGYVFRAQAEAKAKEAAALKSALARAKRKSRAVRNATTDVHFSDAIQAASTVRSADGPVQHDHQGTPGGTG